MGPSIYFVKGKGMAIYVPMPKAKELFKLDNTSRVHSCHPEDVWEVRELVLEHLKYQLDNEQIPNRMMVFEQFQLLKDPKVRYTREQDEMFDQLKHHWQPTTRRQFGMFLNLQNAFLDGVKERCNFRTVDVTPSYAMQCKPTISEITFTTYYTPRFV